MIRWINVNERLPKVEGNYYVKYGKYSYRKESYFNGYGFTDNDPEELITHWLEEIDDSAKLIELLERCHNYMSINNPSAQYGQDLMDDINNVLTNYYNDELQD